MHSCLRVMPCGAPCASLASRIGRIFKQLMDLPSRRLWATLGLLLFLIPGAEARDWFVRAGGSEGDGSRARPFSDPWQALDKLEAGDRVHVTEGRYFGKLEAGYWVIPFPRVELYGGYNGTFTQRDPWKWPSELLWKKGSQNRTDTSVARVSGSNKDHSGVVLDGFVIDMRDLNNYAAGEFGGLTEPRLQQAISLEHPGAMIRNCIIANSALTAVRIRRGVTVENNVIVNSVDIAIDATGGNTLSGNKNTDPPLIRNNTIVGTWVSGSPAGKGGAGGIGIKVDSGTVIEGNIIALTANHAIWLGRTPPASIALRGNLFFRNLFSVVKFYFDGKDSALNDSEMESLVDLGFGALQGNTLGDPVLPYDPRWLDRFTLHAFNQGKVFKAEDWNGLRAAAGLAPLKERGEAFAPAYDVKLVSGLLAPGNPAVKAGARTRAIEVKPFAEAGSATVSKTYQKTDVAAWARRPESVDGKALEMVVSLQSVTSATGVSGISRETHGAKFIEGRVGGGDRIVGIYRKGSSAERVFEEARYFGSFVGEATELYLVRGTARASSEYPKARFIVDSIERYEVSVATVARPVGRDWYVRAEEKGGDGSREKPFRDPYQALEKAVSGDVIHVTEGEYGGKLKRGNWVIEKPWLALLGGYDRNFNARDPWQRPSLLHWPADSNTKGQGYLLEGAGDHTGLIVDGFAFDHRTLNRYLADGSLDPSASDSNEHVWVFSPGVVIRNCVFANGGMGSLRMAPAQTIENNIFVNQYGMAISVQGGGTATTPPTVIRNNSFLMVWDRVYGDRARSSGNGLLLRSSLKTEIEGNLFQFIDNNAIYSGASENELTLVGNVFSFSGWSNYRHEPKTVDDGNMPQLADVGFKKSSGNVVANPNVPYEASVFEAYYLRGSVAQNSKRTPEEWVSLRTEAGLAPPAPGAKLPFAPAMDYRQAVTLFPRNPAVKAGAHPQPLDSKVGR